MDKRHLEQVGTDLRAVRGNTRRFTEKPPYPKQCTAQVKTDLRAVRLLGAGGAAVKTIVSFASLCDQSFFLTPQRKK